LERTIRSVAELRSITVQRRSIKRKRGAKPTRVKAKFYYIPPAA